MDTFQLKVISSDRVFYEGRCRRLIIPAPDGQKGILPHHENMIIAVEIGELHLQDEEGNWITASVSKGFAEIMNNRVSVLVNTAESPEEIDVRRADRSQRACPGAAPAEAEYSGIPAVAGIACKSYGKTSCIEGKRLADLIKGGRGFSGKAPSPFKSL